MTDDEKIKCFGEMVEAAERLSKNSSEPWRKACIIVSVISAIAILCLSFLLGMIIYMSYMEPVVYGQEQTQNYEEQTQGQSYHYSESGDWFWVNSISDNILRPAQNKRNVLAVQQNVEGPERSGKKEWTIKTAQSAP